MKSRWGTAALILTWSSTPMTTQTVPAACQSMWSSLVPTNSTSTRSSWGRISVPRRTEVSVCSTVYSRGKRGRGVGSSLSRQTGVSVCSPVYRYGWRGGRSEWVSEVLYQGRQRSVSAHLSTVWGRVGGVQSSVLRQTEVSVSLPLYSCEGEVRSVWAVLLYEGLTVRIGEGIYINCLINTLSSCEFGVWFTVHRDFDWDKVLFWICKIHSLTSFYL